MLKETGVAQDLVEIGHKLTYAQAVTAGRTGKPSVYEHVRC